MLVKKLMAGVAAFAMLSGVAHAGVVYQGSVTATVPFLGPVTSTNTVAVLAADVLNPGVGSNTALITISGSSQGNNGTASNTDGATFTLKGSVTPDCAYYSGNADTNIDFGTIGIYASDNTGPANAFDMTAPANVSIDTNLAGCNTANTVSINKGDIRGLVNNSGSGYDANVFQANLPYNVTATYSAGAVGSTAGVAAAADHIFVADTANAGAATHGAWKSAMLVKINVPVAAKSLLAGNYSDTLKVEIKAN
jgi:hypothetical protein